MNAYPLWIEKILAELGGLATVDAIDLKATQRIPRQSMQALVFGLAALALVGSLSTAGCATAPRPLDTETVGTLTPTTANVFTVAVHADTPLATEAFVVAASDDDAAMVVASAPEEAPAIAPKAALVMGGAR
jgi:hypothetical protein